MVSIEIDMAPRSTQPLTEISQHQEYFPKDEGGRCLGLTTLPPSCAVCLEIWEPQPPEPSGSVQADAETGLPLHIRLFVYVPYFEKRKGWYGAESELMVILVRVDGKEFESPAMLRPPRRIFLHIQLRTILFWVI
jgi:hypothetical protein